MKINLYFFIIIGITLSSCGINVAHILNQNQNTTQVQLSQNNFKVVDEVRATAQVKYICMIGGMNRSQLYSQAYADLIKKANIHNTSKALINLTTEEHISGVPIFYYQRTIIVSANVIEFIR